MVGALLCRGMLHYANPFFGKQQGNWREKSSSQNTIVAVARGHAGSSSDRGGLVFGSETDGTEGASSKRVLGSDQMCVQYDETQWLRCCRGSHGRQMAPVFRQDPMYAQHICNTVATRSRRKAFITGVTGLSPPDLKDYIQMETGAKKTV